MMPVPATIENDVAKKLDVVFRRAGSYIDANGPEYDEIATTIDKLSSVNAALRSCYRARLSALTGNREDVEYYLNNARRLNVDSAQYDLAQITALMTLGYYSEATPVIRSCGDPERNLINIFLKKPPTSGLFHLMWDFHEKAIAMNLTNVPQFPEALKAAIPIMDYWGDSDEDYAAALDFAGIVLRRHKLLAKNNGLRVEVFGQPKDGSLPYVKLSFDVDVDLETSVEMTCEYSELLASSSTKIPHSLIFEFSSATS